MRLLSTLILTLGLLTGCSAERVSRGPSDRWINCNGGLLATDACRRLDLASARVVRASGVAVRLHVLDTQALGAWSWPGGDVYVSRGLIETLSAAELAAVVGHEIGHLCNLSGTPDPVALSGRFTEDDASECAADAVAVTLLKQAGEPSHAMAGVLRKLIEHPQSSPAARISFQKRLFELTNPVSNFP